MIKELIIPKTNQAEIPQQDYTTVNYDSGYFAYRSKTKDIKSSYIVCILKEKFRAGYYLSTCGFEPVDDRVHGISELRFSGKDKQAAVESALKSKRQVYRFDTLQELYKAMGDQLI